MNEDQLKKLVSAAEYTALTARDIENKTDETNSNLEDILKEMKKQTTILNQILEEILKRE